MVVLEPLVAAVGVDVGVPRQGWPAPPDFEIMDPNRARAWKRRRCSRLRSRQFRF
jgi:hypothetical protein